MGILFPIGNLKSPIGDNISDRGLGIYESGKAESENKSLIPNWIKYHQLANRNIQLGIYYPIGDIIPNWVLSSVSTLISAPFEIHVNSKLIFPGKTFTESVPMPIQSIGRNVCVCDV